MAIEMNIRILGETVLDVMSEMGMLSSRLYAGLGVAQTPPDTEPPAEAVEATKTAADANGAGKPASTRKRGPKPEPEPKIDRAGIIDGLTKIYSKGDPDVRLAITKFRDGQGADRLRDLKDDALPAAADLLAELKLAESADAP